MRRGIRILLRSLLAGFVAIQFVPYGHDHTNPPVTAEPAWNSPFTRSLAQQSCFDCHSNQTTWYWFTNIAPFSWLAQSDVQNGRAALNFSEWNRPQDGADSYAEVIRDGSMPPWYYTAVHWGARLSAKEKAELIAGLQATYAASPPIAGG